jgi:hypothetical protein
VNQGIEVSVPGCYATEGAGIDPDIWAQCELLVIADDNITTGYFELMERSAQ